MHEGVIWAVLGNRTDYRPPVIVSLDIARKRYRSGQSVTDGFDVIEAEEVSGVVRDGERGRPSLWMIIRENSSQLAHLLRC